MEFRLDWAEELASGSALACLRNITFVVMAGSRSVARVHAQQRSWAQPLVQLLPERLLIMSDRTRWATGERTTAALRGRTSKQDAPSRLIEGLRVAYEDVALRSSSAWVLCVDDDTWVNLPQMMLLAARFDSRSPSMMGHFLNKVWQPWINDTAFSGGGGLLLSRAAFLRFGRALSRREMPLPAPRVESDVHLHDWARALGVRRVHSHLFWDNAVSADARRAHAVSNSGGCGAAACTALRAVANRVLGMCPPVGARAAPACAVGHAP